MSGQHPSLLITPPIPGPTHHHSHATCSLGSSSSSPGEASARTEDDPCKALSAAQPAEMLGCDEGSYAERPRLSSRPFPAPHAPAPPLLVHHTVCLRVVVAVCSVAGFVCFVWTSRVGGWAAKAAELSIFHETHAFPHHLLQPFGPVSMRHPLHCRCLLRAVDTGGGKQWPWKIRLLTSPFPSTHPHSNQHNHTRPWRLLSMASPWALTSGPPTPAWVSGRTIVSRSLVSARAKGEGEGRGACTLGHKRQLSVYTMMYA